MNKQDELDILRAAAKKLGKDSYCGPFLAMLIPQIEQDILSDLMPEFDLRKVHGDCAEARERARKECEQMHTQAEKEREAIVNAARKWADSHKSVLLSSIADAVRVIEGSAQIARSPYARY